MADKNLVKKFKEISGDKVWTEEKDTMCYSYDAAPGEQCPPLILSSDLRPMTKYLLS